MQKKSANKIALMLASSSLAKIFSLLSKIVLTSLLGLSAMSYFSLTNPLLILIITICSFSLPNVLSHLIAKKPNKSKKYVITSFLIVILNGIIFSIILLSCSKFIAKELLHNEGCYFAIRAISIFIPFICISSLIKGYFLGNREVLLTTSSQLFEEGSRLVFNYLCVGYLLSSSSERNAALVIISLAVGEFFQTIYLVIFCNKKYYPRYKKIVDLKDADIKETSKEMLSIASLMTGARLIGSFTYFLEPIIITTILSYQNIASSSIALEYSTLNTYVMPLLLLPGFFSTTLSNYLLPNLSYNLGKGEKKAAKTLFLKVTLLCSLIGISFSFFFLFFGSDVLKLLYHIDSGQKEIRMLALPFFIYYLETPFITAMNALSLNKHAFLSTIISSLIRIVLLLVLTPILGVFSLCIATLSSCLASLLFNGYFITRNLFFNNQK